MKIWVEGFSVGTGRQENKRKIKEEINGCSEIGHKVGLSKDEDAEGVMDEGR